MKKLVLIIVVITLASYETFFPLVSFVDYSSYNDDGIFLTESNSVSFKYEPIGSVNVILYSGYTVEKKKELSGAKKEKGDDVYFSPTAGAMKFRGSTTQDGKNGEIDHLISV